MTDAEKELARILRVRFGLAPHEPNQEQLNRIIGDIQRRVRGVEPSLKDWGLSVGRYCDTIRNAVYSGIDNSDLAALLALITKKRPSR